METEESCVSVGAGEAISVDIKRVSLAISQRLTDFPVVSDAPCRFPSFSNHSLNETVGVPMHADCKFIIQKLNLNFFLILTIPGPRPIANCSFESQGGTRSSPSACLAISNYRTMLAQFQVIF